MKILALDSSSLVAGVAVLCDEKLVGEFTVNYKKTHSQTLLPMLDMLAKMIELDMNTLDAIAITSGPGSFTGLRIGSATAKGLAMALDKPIIPVKTVDALAYNLWGSANLVCPIMNARRNQTYTGLYEFKDGEMVTLKEQCAVDIKEIIEIINEKNRPVTFLGDGMEVFRESIAENIKVPYDFAPANKNEHSAASVGALGMILYKKGVMETSFEHKPDYLRLSQAERERLKAGKAIE
ncbi:MAG: tRNA (adenosine(37)-N6)-threonylcarbamoyltransferase complex dimerization subunit type 1 TsaB [Lachnospiraceae bacterium]|nr:tRNA (adenosine(37)-N6)-threonylcarbamoyltransferase complex dimerization subunit type 1 TsaB [Lachnospiraceae bacterium]